MGMQGRIVCEDAGAGRMWVSQLFLLKTRADKIRGDFSYIFSGQGAAQTPGSWRDRVWGGSKARQERGAPRICS